MTKPNKYVMIYRLDYAMELKKLGHEIVETCPNPRNSTLTAFIFEKDESFEEDFNTILRGE
jgi:hypothetical protein